MRTFTPVFDQFQPGLVSGYQEAVMKRRASYQPPFPYFGGSSPVAETIWEALGSDVLNYVEPFVGSGAVLFLRPGGAGHIETINDADGFCANAWRSIQKDSDAVAEYADDIVSEVDLHARHLWLIGQRESLTDRLCGDHDWFDAKAAGWWIWGLCCWIGSGWCSGFGPWHSVNGVMTKGDDDGTGSWRKRPHLGNPGQGVNRQLPHLGRGKGVNRKLPILDEGRRGLVETSGTGTIEDRSEWLRGYLRGFAARLRNVRVCCGDWSRVCGPSVTFRHGPTGVFLDPPYADTAERTSNLYAVDCEQVAHAAREWAIEQGTNPLMRIVLKGYEGEHVMPDNWRVLEWKAVGGYGLQGTDEDKGGRANSRKERLWFSPFCLKPRQGGLFE